MTPTPESKKSGAFSTSGSAGTTASSRDPGKDRNRITVSLQGLGPRLRAYSRQRHMPMSGAIRSAILQMLDTGTRDALTDLQAQAVHEDRTVTLWMRVSPACAALVAQQAKVYGLSKARYVNAMLLGAPPPPVPAERASLASALMASTDRLADLSSDLNAFLGLLGRVPVAELEPYRARLDSLAGEVRAHLVSAATVLAELKPLRVLV